MSNPICLKWNSFLDNIATSFESLWEEEVLVDVTLASDGQCLTAHKVVLSASSPFFKKVFQTNPCQHPVIILQDVHFSELEALLTFIYKGEVNIEHEKLPALLKAADALQIRGLSGEDVLQKGSYKKLSQLSEDIIASSLSIPNDIPRKRQKLSKNNSILKKVLATELTETSAQNQVTEKFPEPNTHNTPDIIVPDETYHLEMKLEPFDVNIDELERKSPSDKDALEQLDTGQINHSEGNESNSAEEIVSSFELSSLNELSEIKDTEPLLYPYQNLPYANMLPGPEVISTWAAARPMDHLACDIMKILFTNEERVNSNVNGKMGKRQFDCNKIHLIKEVLLHFSGIPPNSPEWEEVWKTCVTKIDTSNRGLKRYLFQRRFPTSQ